MSDLNLGAPSLSGADVRENIEAMASGVKWPLTARVTNLLPMRVSYPWAGGLLLAPSGHDGSAGDAVFRDHETLLRFVTDVQALAELNHAEVALRLALPAQQSARASKASREPSKTESKTE